MSGTLAPVRAEIAALGAALRLEMAAWADTLREEWGRDLGRVHEVLRQRDADRDARAEAARSQRERARALVPDMPVNEWTELRQTVERHESVLLKVLTRVEGLERR